MDSIYKLGIILSVIDQMTGPVKKMTQSVVDLEKNIQRAKGMVDFGQKLAVSGALVDGAAQKMRGVLGSLISPVTEVNDSIAALSTVTTSTMGSMQKSLNFTSQAAIEWERNHRETADKFIATTQILASAGLNDLQAVYGTQTALGVATATFGDHAQVANTLSTVYNNMGNKTANVQREMARLGDVMTRTQQAFQLPTFNVLSEGLKYGTPAALQARMSFAELNTVIGSLNNAGLQGGMAGTVFAATMRNLNRASKDLGFTIGRTADGGISLIATLENINKKYGDLSRASPKVQMAFQRAFGDEGMRAIALLGNQTGIMYDNLKKIQNSAGTVVAAQMTIEGTETAEYQIMLNNIKSLKRELGMELLPIIKLLLPEVRNLIKSFSGFASAHPNLVKTTIILFAIGTGLLSLLAPIITVMAGLIMMGGYGWMSLAKLGLGFKWLYHTPIKKWLLPGFGSIYKIFRILLMFIGKNSLAVLRLLGSRLILLATRIIPMLVTGIWSLTAAMWANPMTPIIMGVIALGIGLYALYKNWDKVKVIAGIAMQYLTGAVTSGLDWVSGKVSEFKQSGAALIYGFTDGIKSAINTPVAAMKSGLQKVRNLLPFSDAREGPLSTLTKSGMAMINTFGDGAMKTLPRLQDMLNTGFGELPVVAGGYGQVSQRDIKPILSSRGSDRPSITINGDIIIKVEKLDNEESVFNIFRRLAKGVED